MIGLVVVEADVNAVGVTPGGAVFFSVGGGVGAGGFNVGLEVMTIGAIGCKIVLGNRWERRPCSWRGRPWGGQRSRRRLEGPR